MQPQISGVHPIQYIEDEAIVKDGSVEAGRQSSVDATGTTGTISRYTMMTLCKTHPNKELTHDNKLQSNLGGTKPIWPSVESVNGTMGKKETDNITLEIGTDRKSARRRSSLWKSSKKCLQSKSSERILPVKSSDHLLYVDKDGQSSMGLGMVEEELPNMYNVTVTKNIVKKYLDDKDTAGTILKRSNRSIFPDIPEEGIAESGSKKEQDIKETAVRPQIAHTKTSCVRALYKGVYAKNAHGRYYLISEMGDSDSEGEQLSKAPSIKLCSQGVPRETETIFSMINKNKKKKSKKPDTDWPPSGYLRPRRRTAKPLPYVTHILNGSNKETRGVIYHYYYDYQDADVPGGSVRCPLRLTIQCPEKAPEKYIEGVIDEEGRPLMYSSKKALVSGMQYNRCSKSFYPPRPPTPPKFKLLNRSCVSLTSQVAVMATSFSVNSKPIHISAKTKDQGSENINYHAISISNFSGGKGGVDSISDMNLSKGRGKLKDALSGRLPISRQGGKAKLPLSRAGSAVRILHPKSISRAGSSQQLKGR